MINRFVLAQSYYFHDQCQEQNQVSWVLHVSYATRSASYCCSRQNEVTIQKELARISQEQRIHGQGTESIVKRIRFRLEKVVEDCLNWWLCWLIMSQSVHNYPEINLDSRNLGSKVKFVCPNSVALCSLFEHTISTLYVFYLVPHEDHFVLSR